VFYISEDSHLAWIKIAHQAGIGRAAAKLVPTDSTGRMSVDALESAICADQRLGHQPFMVVATAGTTNAGMVDPLLACSEVARRHNLWYHVDAAWGGGAIASDRLKSLLVGIERADSVTIDAHKWFATTMGCGMFLTAHPSVLSDTFNVMTSFMPSHTPSLDPYVTTAQWSRRFLGLRLFLALGAGGWGGYGAHVEQAVELGQGLADLLTQAGWRVVNEPRLAVVCALPPGGSAPVREVARRVVASGGAWVSAARLAGHDVLRACVTNGETTPADIACVAELLVKHSVM
jgi:glutamate/tyrosine decarboxylase-like PLP-dependent enzyme